jgi:bifunctional polynucleotide phosphatase/kinase
VAVIAPLTAIAHPFFTSGPKELGTFLPSPATLIHYIHLDPFTSLSPERDSPGPSDPNPTKVPIVFYDLDGTLIKTQSGAEFPKSRNDWTWWNACVPGRLKEERGEGKHIVVISNQGDGREKIRTEWRAKLPLIAAKVSPVGPDDPLGY